MFPAVLLAGLFAPPSAPMPTAAAPMPPPAPVVLVARAAAPEDTPTAPIDGFPEPVQWTAALSCVRVAIKTGTLAAGTGVVVGHRDGSAYVLTAAHVVAEETEWEVESFTRASYPLAAVVHKGVVVSFRHPNSDVALLRVPVEKPLTAAPLAGPKQRPTAFPAAGLSVGCDAGRPPRCAAASILAKRLVKESALLDEVRGFFWETAEGSVRGRSGGPLFDRDGRVIGLCSGVKEATGRAYYTHLDEILAGLARNGHGWLWERK